MVTLCQYYAHMIPCIHSLGKSTSCSILPCRQLIAVLPMNQRREIEGEGAVARSAPASGWARRRGGSSATLVPHHGRGLERRPSYRQRLGPGEDGQAWDLGAKRALGGRSMAGNKRKTHHTCEEVQGVSWSSVVTTVPQGSTSDVCLMYATPRNCWHYPTRTLWTPLHTPDRAYATHRAPAGGAPQPVQRRIP